MAAKRDHSTITSRFLIGQQRVQCTTEILFLTRNTCCFAGSSLGPLLFHIY